MKPALRVEVDSQRLVYRLYLGKKTHLLFNSIKDGMNWLGLTENYPDKEEARKLWIKEYLDRCECEQDLVLVMGYPTDFEATNWTENSPMFEDTRKKLAELEDGQ